MIWRRIVAVGGALVLFDVGDGAMPSFWWLEYEPAYCKAPAFYMWNV